MAHLQLTTKDKVSRRKIIPVNFYHRAFDILGYSKTLTEKRIKIIDNYADCLTRVAQRNWNEGYKVLVAGSRGEGMAVALGSDIDVLFIQPAVKCFETYQLARSMHTAGDVASFQLDLAHAPEGYAKLRLIAIQGSDQTKHAILLERLNGALAGENLYLRNDRRLSSVIENDSTGVKREGWVSVEIKFEERSGPAQPHKTPLPADDTYFNVDYVEAFPCYYPSALADVCKRERQHAWPSKAVIDAIKESEILVVPAGEPGKDDVLNWRISFSHAEQLLVHSFNDTQIKVYAALKMLVKHHLKRKCSSISSYVVKNIVFLVFERSQSEFAETDFIDLILQALLIMKDCVSQKRLQNYMIPSRNMFKNRISETEKEDLLQCIYSLIANGKDVLLRCPLVKEMSRLIHEGDNVGLQKRLKLRELLDQILYSYFSLPVETHNKTEKRLSTSEIRAETILLFIRDVFPITRQSNPFDYFNLLVSMTDIEIVSHFIEGFIDDWIYRWVEYNRGTEPSYEHCSKLNETDLHTLKRLMEGLL